MDEANFVPNQRDYNSDHESPMNPNSISGIQVTLFWATMAIDNQCDGEIVKQPTNFQKGG